MAKKRDVPGNAMASVAAVQKQMLRLADCMYIFEGRWETEDERGEQLKTIRLRAPQDVGGEWLAVVTRYGEQGAEVAFHSAPGFVECMKGLIERANNGSLKWKADQYAE